MAQYDHKEIEKKWQKTWEQNKIYTTPDEVPGKENFYLLVEFPYPSGNLHVGHWYAFAVPDILARYQRMQGKNVMYPIGFDAFGLPAENAAIKNKLNPRTWTEQNIAYMTKQIQSMGTSFDWSRKVSTIDPEYYKWTQWLFLQLYKKGLVYQKETAVNWCPTDKTVLANEQVVDGKCERCGSEVIQRQMLQWNIKITDYADRLVDDLESLDWPEQIKESQRNWIGRSEGAEIDFPIDFPGKVKYVILHGFTSSPDRKRFGWLKNELEKLGHEVLLPRLPNTDAPTEEGQVAAALAATTYDENTILCGFSLGAVVAMKVVEKLNVKIKGLVLAGGFVDRDFKDKPRPFDKTFHWAFDRDKIHDHAGFVVALHDVNDFAISTLQKEHLEATLGIKAQLVTADKPHFKGDKEPAVLRALMPHVTVFTTRPDTLFGATYLVLAPEHPWVTQALQHKTVLANNAEVQKYVDQANRKTELERQTETKDKTGVKLEGVEAVNPATGEKIPLYVADYVLGHYGTGAIMAVPAHDERDYDFAKKFGLPIKQVIQSNDATSNEVYTGDGTLANSGKFDGMSVAEAKKAIAAEFGRAKKTYRLRDWIVSRQRYWGVPIPIIHCKKCGHVPVLDTQLPVVLPDVEDYLPTGDGKSPLAKVSSFVNVQCPRCGREGKRETDTLDTFVDSSWYFLRYTDPKNANEFASKGSQAKWMPIDLYSGGAEHTTMHLLYSRFWHKALYDCGLVEGAEPYARRMNRSIILGPDGQKMSKSRGNVIDPDEVVERLGADTVRMYLSFIGPYNEVASYPWNPDGVVGVRRFLERVWRISEKLAATADTTLESHLHRAIKKVGEDVARMKFNTAISAMMIFLNEAEKSAPTKEQFATFLRLLAPFAPHISEELWQGVLGKKDSIHTHAWPSYDEKLLIDETVTYAIQIDGKTRGDVSVAQDADKTAVEAAARDAVAARLEGQEIARVVIVPKRLVNFVLRQ
jgi:leucyl-tRNA synthetase